MTQIEDEKLQYDIDKEAARISALSSSNIAKYEYLTGEEILPFNQKQIVEEAKFIYSPLGKAFEKQKKDNGISREKTNWCFKDLGLKDKKETNRSNWREIWWS